VQFDPIKPTLKAPEGEPLKPKCDELLSGISFNFNLRRFTEVLDVAILVVYTAEMCARVFALGFARNPHAYLRNAYNRLDFAVVVASWALVLAHRIGGGGGGLGGGLPIRTSLGQGLTLVHFSAQPELF
jgi:hypothetical protein